jgi:hypothetical protein
MASVILGKEERLVVNLNEVNYIPDYKIYEEERQQNELERIAYYESLQQAVENGEFDGEQGVPGERGPEGPQGPIGDNGVWVGSNEPADEQYTIWIDENGEESTIPTKTSQLENDSNFITEENLPKTFIKLEGDSNNPDVLNELQEGVIYYNNKNTYISYGTAKKQIQKGFYIFNYSNPVYTLKMISLYNNGAGGSDISKNTIEIIYYAITWYTNNIYQYEFYPMLCTQKNKNENIEGNYTFTKAITNNVTPTSDTHLVNKGYVDGLVPTKTSQLENDNSYASESYVTNAIANAQLGEGGEVDLSGYATKDELLNKVDKVVGKSLIADSEIERLANVTNYDDTAILNALESKANANDIPANLYGNSSSTATNKITYGTEEPSGGNNGDIYFLYS